jgi:hypothetical protein
VDPLGLEFGNKAADKFTVIEVFNYFAGCNHSGVYVCIFVTIQQMS